MLDSVKLLVVRSRECYESLQRYAKCISLFIPLPLFRNFKKIGSAHHQISNIPACNCSTSNVIKNVFLFKTCPSVTSSGPVSCYYKLALMHLFLASSPAQLKSRYSKPKGILHILYNIYTPSVLARRFYGAASIPQQQTSKQVFCTALSRLQPIVLRLCNYMYK